MPFDRAELEHMAGCDKPDDVAPFCLTCGYNLTGVVSARCPECGHYFDFKEWQKQVAELKSQIRDVENAVRCVPNGLKVAIGGAVVLGLGWAVGPGTCWMWLSQRAARRSPFVQSQCASR